jgi:methionyl-tRNA synthetase
VIGMSSKYSAFEINSVDVLKFHSSEIKKAEDIIENIHKYIYSMQLNRYLEELWKILTIANQSIATYEPWAKIKEGKTDEAMALVALVANLLIKVSVLLSPIMPKTCATIANAMDVEINSTSYEKIIEQHSLLETFKIKKTPPLFPRLEDELLIVEKPKVVKEAKKEKAKKSEGIITIDQFFETKIKIGTILEAKEVKKSDRLFALKVDVGEDEPRSIIAGIREFYKIDELINTQVCVVSNLKPAKIMGNLSQGMLLAAKDEDGLSLIRPEKPKKSGTPIG